MIKIEYCKAVNGEFFARIKARNGKILMTTETYKRKRGPKEAIELIKKSFIFEDAHRGRKNVQEIELW